MTTPLSGSPISVVQIAIEAGLTASATRSLNFSAFDAVRGTSATSVSMSQFYAKTNRILSAGGNVGSPNYGYSNGSLIGQPVVGSLVTKSSSGLDVILLQGVPSTLDLWVLGSLSVDSISYISLGTIAGNTTVYSIGARNSFGNDSDGAGNPATHWHWDITTTAMSAGVTYLFFIH